MFAQPYGALPPVPTPSPGDDDDVWHVAVSWDDVKVMSVEQLDDAFRLDIINSETPVWQKGMSGWEPLGVVAGIGGDDDDDEDSQEDVLTDAELEVVWPPFPAPIKPSAVRSARPTPAPPRPPSRAPTPPTPIGSSRVPTSTGWPSFAPAVPAPPTRQEFAPVIPLAPRPAPTASLVPPAGFGAPSALYQAANANAVPRHPPTLPPVAVSVTMPPPRYRGPSTAGRVGRWVLALAFVGGVLTTLYRNDVLLEAAQKNGFEKQYLSAERAIVGTPGFGTLRSLAALIAGDKSAPTAAIAVTTPSSTVDDTKAEPPPATTDEDKPSTTTKTEKAEGAVDISSLKVESPAAKEAPPKAKEEAAPKEAPREVARKEVAPKSEKVSKAEAKAAALKAKAEAAKEAKAAAAKAKAEAREAKAAAAKAKAKAKDKPSDERAAAMALIEKARIARAAQIEASKPVEKAEKAEKSEPKEAPKKAAPPPREEKPAAEKPKTAKGILDAAIRDSMEKSNSAPAKKKKKSGPNAEYDPMNGDL